MENMARNLESVEMKLNVVREESGEYAPKKENTSRLPLEKLLQALEYRV